jgi:hypothetical protein
VLVVHITEILQHLEVQVVVKVMEILAVREQAHLGKVTLGVFTQVLLLHILAAAVVELVLLV